MLHSSNLLYVLPKFKQYLTVALPCLCLPSGSKRPVRGPSSHPSIAVLSLWSRKSESTEPTHIYWASHDSRFSCVLATTAQTDPISGIVGRSPEETRTPQDTFTAATYSSSVVKPRLRKSQVYQIKQTQGCNIHMIHYYRSSYTTSKQIKIENNPHLFQRPSYTWNAKTKLQHTCTAPLVTVLLCYVFRCPP